MFPFVLGGLALLFILSKKTATTTPTGTLVQVMSPAVGLTILPFVVPVGSVLQVNPPPGSSAFACIIVGPTGAAATSNALQPAPFVAPTAGALSFLGSAPGTASLLAAWNDSTGAPQRTTFTVTVA